MLPFLHWETIQIGPLTLYVWGMFVALGAGLAIYLARRAARRTGASSDTVSDAAFWMLTAGLLGGRVGYILFYNPGPYLADPWEAMRLWNGGLSSVGGFLAALAAFLIFVRRRKVGALAIADCLAAGFPFGWAVGRIGCYLTHLHPGILTSSWIAVRYPGGSRFDLGLIESLTGLLVGAVMLIAVRLRPKAGTATFTVLWTYLPIRFFSDFLRAADLPGSDVRIFGLLTPAQIVSAFLLVASLIWFLRLRGRRAAAPAAPVS